MDADASASTGVYYTTSIVVPITLPKDKAFVPTFHSCLVSRIYTLRLSVSYRTLYASVVDPSVLLKVPVQLTYRGWLSSGADFLMEDSGFVDGDAKVDEELDEMFRPRMVAPVPEYTEFARPLSGA